MFKPRFTQLQEKILSFLFENAGENFNQRNLAKKLNVSSTAIAKSIKKLEKENLIIKNKNPSTKIISIGLNRDNQKVIQLKRAENLKKLYESGLFDYLESNFLGGNIILFGSYSFGQDTISSDIDIAIIGNRDKELSIEKFEKILGKKIIIQFYSSFSKIHKELKENLFNGILLQGGVEL
jgi:DNA-binding MarR family transcriptional regulator